MLLLFIRSSKDYPYFLRESASYIFILGYNYETRGLREIELKCAETRIARNENEEGASINFQNFHILSPLFFFFLSP